MTTPALRRLALQRQGLASRQSFGAGMAGTRRAIEHLGYVQIDTISVVERAHHHVLWNRVPGYDPAQLNRLVAGRHVFEYWYHAAAYLPMRDYRFALPRMTAVREGRDRTWAGVDARLMDEILARVRGEGALRVRDLDGGGRSEGGWWNRGPGRRALDRLFMQGDLMVSARNGMEKEYDLAERCLPAGIDRSVPGPEEYAAYLLDTTLRAHGVVTWRQLLHLRTGRPLQQAMRELLRQRMEAGELRALGDAAAPVAYVDARAPERVPARPAAVRVLSPFDNLVIHRERLAWLFGFDYRIECYVPPARRRFGYFCLPVLYGDRFAGRVDCKAHRAGGRLEVLSLHLEAGPLDTDRFFPALRDELQRFAAFNRCPQLDGAAIAGLRREG